jgi:hypothetical protein
VNRIEADSLADAGAPHRARFLAPYLLAGGFLALYLLTLSPNLGAAHDSVYYLRSIETGRHLLHPHHLLYNSTARSWWRLTGHDDPVAAAEGLNALAGAIVVFMIFVMSARHRVFWAALWGTSFGAWFYATTIEVYILPLPFLLGAFALAEKSPRTTPNAIVLGALHAGAVLYHQTNLLMLPCLLFALRRSGLRTMAIYLGALTVAAGAPYLAASAALQNDLGPWSTTYLRELDLGRLTLGTPVKVLEGMSRFFIGGHFLFATPLKEWLAARLGGEHHLADEVFLVGNLGRSTGILLGIAAAAWFVGAAGLLARGARGFRWDDSRVRLAAVWFVPYAVFFAWWEPRNVEFWIATMLPLFLAGSTIDFRSPDARPLNPRYLAIIPLALLAINYAGSIRFLADPERDWYRAEAAKYAQYGPGDIVHVKDDWILGPYIERTTGAKVVRDETVR